MDNPLLALFIPSLLIVPAMGLLSGIESHSAVTSELRRKALHLGVGLTALSFPLFLTNVWLVVSALGIVFSWMLAVRKIPALSRRFGCVLHGAGRKSHGELYFSVAIAGLLLLPQSNPALYVVPVMILAIADAAAAVVGRAWPIGHLGGLARGKTASGAAAFAISALLITSLALAYFTPLSPLMILLIGVFVSALTTYTEAVSSHGVDNFAVPAIAWLALYSTIGGV
jgi:phytol kinase